MVIAGVGHDNLTNSSDVATDGTLDISLPGFLGYYIPLLLTAPVVSALAVLTIAALCCNSRVSRALAVFLVNHLAACIIVVVGCTLMLSNTVAQTIDKAAITNGTGTEHLPPLPWCQLWLWLFGIGSVARLWSLLGFSIVVLVTVRYGQKVFKTFHLVIGVAGVWIVSFLLNLHITLPYPVYAVHYIDGVGCYPHNSRLNRATRYSTMFIWVVFGGLVPLGVSITIPIITLCYIKRNTVSQDSHYNKGIAKFALFVVVGNIVSLLGQTMTGLIALQSEAIGLLISLFLSAISVLPAPVVIIAFVKPVRERVKTIVCYLPTRLKCTTYNQLLIASA